MNNGDNKSFFSQITGFFRQLTPRQLIVYAVGIMFLACGITMNTKTRLGISPIVSVAHTFSILLGVPFSVTTFVQYCVLILIQVLLLRRDFNPVQWLQLLASFLTSAFIDLFDRFLPVADSLVGRYVLLLVAIVFTGIGAILTLGADFVPNPADGTVKVISIRTGIGLGMCKNGMDLLCILISVALGLLFRGSLLSIGVGTVVTMLLTGRVIALLNKPLLHLTRLDAGKEAKQKP